MTSDERTRGDALFPGRGQALPEAGAFADALLVPDRKKVERLFRSALAAGAPFATACAHIIQPAMHQLGELWAANRCSVAQEHLATALCQTLIARAASECEAAVPNGVRVLVAGVPGNHHALGAQIVADTLELEGYEVDYTGADTPLADLVEQVRRRRPRVVLLSASLPSQLPATRECVAALRAPGETRPQQVVVGGQAFRGLEHPAESVGADAFYADAEELLSHFDRL